LLDGLLSFDIRSARPPVGTRAVKNVGSEQEWKPMNSCVNIWSMTWKVYEEANRRYRKLRRKLSDRALSELERRGFAAQRNGTSKTKASAVRPPVEERRAEPSG
jgi:hypothetical protein